MRIDFAPPQPASRAATNTQDYSSTDTSTNTSEEAPGSTLVVQSHRTPLPFALLSDCLASVQQWAQAQGYAYQFVGDELFELLPGAVQDQLGGRLVIASDVARLLLLEQALAAGYSRVVWFDADVYVLPDAPLMLPKQGFAVGRETWIQARDGQPRLYKKVHNAILQSSRQDPVLAFYLDRALALLAAKPQAMPDQFVGPKLLTAWHNIAPFRVAEQVNMLPPLVAVDLAQPPVAGSKAVFLAAYQRGLTAAPAALNLCASAVRAGEVTEAQLERAMLRIRAEPQLLRPLP